MPDESKHDRRRFAVLCATALCLIGLALRFGNFFSALEYDEIWTLREFSFRSVPDILSMLSLPNNHPLNTLLIKLVVVCNPAACWIRLPAWIAGALSLPLVWLVARLWSGNRSAALWSLGFFVFSAPAVYYAQQARGYSIQLFFLLLFAAGLAMTHRYRPRRHGGRYLPEAAIFLGGAGSILTLPTSILYLGAVTLTGLAVWNRRRFRIQPATIVTLGLGAVLSLLWYGLNLDQFRAAQSWGFDVTDPVRFRNFVADTSVMLAKPVELAAFLAALLFAFKKNWRLLPVLLLPFLAALVTQGGPARTYLPLTALFAVGAGSGCAALLRRCRPRPFAVMAALLIAAGTVVNYTTAQRNWRNTDWYGLYGQIHRLPPETFVILGANVGNPYSWNNQPNAVLDHRARLENRAALRSLLVFSEPDTLNGIDATGGEKTFPMQLNHPPQPRTVAGIDANEYRLRKLDGAPPPGATVLAFIRPLPARTVAAMAARLAPAGEWLRVNPWLTALPGKENAGLRCLVLAARIEDPARLDWSGLLADAGTGIGLYLVESAPPEK